MDREAGGKKALAGGGGGGGAGKKAFLCSLKKLIRMCSHNLYIINIP